MSPDVEVDNDPRRTYDGHDDQLAKTIEILKDWLKSDPIVPPKNPGKHTDMSLPKEYEACESE